MGLDTCAICLSKMLPDQMCAMGSCTHTFHYTCIARVVRDANNEDHVNCPLCRTSSQRVGDFAVQEILHPRALVLAYMHSSSKLTDNILALETSDKFQWFGDGIMHCISTGQVTDAEGRIADQLVKRYVKARVYLDTGYIWV